MSTVTTEIENLARSLVSVAFPNHTNCPIKISSGISANGANLLGLIYNVSASDEKNTIHLVLKMAPQKDYFRTAFSVREIYKTEIFAYEQILYEFSRIQVEKRLARQFQAFARMYASSADLLRESLLMENVKSKGFKLINHREPVDYFHASLIMREMGRFHALSYAVRDQKPEIFDSWEDQCHESVFFTNIQVPASKGITSLINSVINSYPRDQNENERRALEELVRNLSTIYKSGLFDSSEDRKYSVVTHGDLDIRNLLFKYENPDDFEHPTELCLLDWQLMRLASPALDILSFMFRNSNVELRRQYYTKLIDEYYDSLSSFLRELGSDPEVLLPFPILLRHLRKFSGFMLLITIWFSATCTKEDDDVRDFFNFDNEDALADMISFVPTRVYLQRMRELVSDMIKFDFPFSKLVDH